MGEDRARFLARRVREQYSLSPRATLDELLDVCRQRGIVVVWRDDLVEPGYYVPWPFPTILLRPDATGLVVAHELCHDLEADHRAHDLVSAYSAEPSDRPEETIAYLFALELCGSDARPGQIFPPGFVPVRWRPWKDPAWALVDGMLLTGNQLFERGLRAVAAVLGRPVPVPRSAQRRLTPDEADLLLRSICRLVEAEQI